MENTESETKSLVFMAYQFSITTFLFKTSFNIYLQSLIAEKFAKYKRVGKKIFKSNHSATQS